MKYAVLTLLLATLSACTTVREAEQDPEGVFGQREESSADGRVTTVIGPEEGGETYRYAQASVQEVRVRPAPASADPVPVEILVKGAFPDSCTELHEAVQVRSGNLVEVSLRTRRPQGALCAAVVRPYRFYLVLAGEFAAGPYTVKVNGGAHPFEIRVPETGP